MSRRYADPVAVRLAPTGCAEDAVRPVGFRWRGRDYTVSGVLARWVEADAWWRGAVTAGLGPGRRTASGKAAVARRSAASPPAVSTNERVLWRVEAGRGGRIGVYDLCCQRGAEPVPDRWSLVRALD